MRAITSTRAAARRARTLARSHVPTSTPTRTGTGTGTRTRTGARARARGPRAQPVAAVAVAAVLALGLVAAACSDDGSSGAATSSPTTTEAGGTRTSTSAARKASATGPSSGCADPHPVAAGETEVHLEFEGQDRWYFRRIPPGYDPAHPAPLVLDLHGYAEGATVHARLSGVGPAADRRGIVTLTPQGQGDAAHAHWTTGLDTTDVRLVGELIDRTERELCIDRSRIDLTGFSNGAFLASAAACRYSDRIAAIAPVAGLRDVPGCELDRHVPVITFHGTGDTFIPYGGGMGAGTATIELPDGSDRTLAQVGPDSPEAAELVPGSLRVPVPQIVDAWAHRDGCEPHPTEQPAAPDTTAVRYRCPRGADVELYRIDGAGHTWPGSATSAMLEGVIGRTTMDLDATGLILDFFDRHPLGG